jgi:toxin ParE1/3/4
MPKFKVSTKAGYDLVEIGQYTQNKFGVTQRNRYLDLINAKFSQLCNDPDIGFSSNKIRRGYYRCPIHKHTVFYKKHNYGIRIIRVLHQRMDWEKNL